MLVPVSDGRQKIRSCHWRMRGIRSNPIKWAIVKTGRLWPSTPGPQAGAIASLSRLAATALWGFGAWWLAAAVVLLADYLRHGPLPYGLGWWAFTFPLGAFTVATLTLARAWHLALLEWAGAALFILLAAFWLTVTARMLRAVRTGEAWRPAAPPR